MQKEIDAGQFAYIIIRSSRRTMALELRNDGQVIVRAPQGMTEMKIHAFVEQKRDWVLQNLEKINSRQDSGETLPKFSEAKKNLYRRRAGEILGKRTAYFAKIMGVRYNRITIREQKTRWGSCSSNRNLNFNWKLVLAPPEVLDYVVVHELCHLKEMNHSSAFWHEVEAVVPDYKARRAWLKENGWRLNEI